MCLVWATQGSPLLDPVAQATPRRRPCCVRPPRTSLQPWHLRSSREIEYYVWAKTIVASICGYSGICVGGRTEVIRSHFGCYKTGRHARLHQSTHSERKLNLRRNENHLIHWANQLIESIQESTFIDNGIFKSDPPSLRRTSRCVRCPSCPQTLSDWPTTRQTTRQCTSLKQKT